MRGRQSRPQHEAIRGGLTGRHAQSEGIWVGCSREMAADYKSGRKSRRSSYDSATVHGGVLLIGYESWNA
jgi:hypothetical protein